MASSSSSSAGAASAAGTGPSVSAAPSSLFFSSLPRLRASQTLAAIEDFRTSEHALFLLESSHFPSVSVDGSLVYSGMWHAFKSKDAEAKSVQRELEAVTQAVEAIHQRASNNAQSSNTHTTAATAAASSTTTGTNTGTGTGTGTNA